MTLWTTLLILLLALMSALAAAPAKVTIYPAPKGEPASEDYQVFVNGKPVFCCSHSDMLLIPSTPSSAGR